MADIFIRTSIAPYRIDTYNALYQKMDMRMCFYYQVASDQHFSVPWLESLCDFTPTYLKGWRFWADSRKICFGIGKILRKEKPEIVIVPEFQPVLFQVLLWRILFRKKFKVISMCDDSIDMILQDRDFSWIHRALRKQVPMLVDNIITLTPAVTEWYKSYCGKGIWMPILMDEGKARARYARLLPDCADLRKQYGLVGKKVLLFVGRLVSLKNVDLAIRAYSRVPREDAVLVIIGEGPERERLEALAASCGKPVLFLGRLEGDSLYVWYLLAEVLILLSSQETFGAVTNEALLAGCRVLVSNRAGSACLVEGDNGRVVDIEDEDAICEALSDLLEQKDGLEGGLRPDLMRVRFNERIDSLVKTLKA